jgi:hypothetical protein
VQPRRRLPQANIPVAAPDETAASPPAIGEGDIVVDFQGVGAPTFTSPPEYAAYSASDAGAGGARRPEHLPNGAHALSAAARRRRSLRPHC